VLVLLKRLVQPAVRLVAGVLAAAALLSSKRVQHTPHLWHRFDTQQQQQQLSNEYTVMLPSSAASASSTRRTCGIGLKHSSNSNSNSNSSGSS
jgi:hypothetical protein